MATAERPNFALIAEGLDVAPALAELARHEDYWMALNDDGTRIIPLLGANDSPLLESDLPECWRLIGEARAILDGRHGDNGRLTYCRIGRMPPGTGLPPHFDGVDGVRERRYQLALASPPGVALTVGGEAKWPRPGELWRIEASRTHSVANDGETDRITILFDTKD